MEASGIPRPRRGWRGESPRMALRKGARMGETGERSGKAGWRDGEKCARVSGLGVGLL